MNIPILESILKYVDEENIMYAMPGHKSGKGFLVTEEGRKFVKSIVQADLTEVDGLDNLHKPEEAILEAKEKLAKLYNVDYANFLVNGSTSGNLAMIFAAFNEGDKIIVERNCHKSIFNAIVLRKLKPIYLKNKISSSLGAPVTIDMEHLLEILKNNVDVKGMFLTYPNYYGFAENFESLRKIKQEFELKLLIDSAHGAHFGITEALPKSALYYDADAIVVSAHKTLPTFTQGAYLLAKNTIDIQLLDYYMKVFTTTSPSYLILATLDYSRYYLETKGKIDYDRAITIANKYVKKINSDIEYIQIIDKNYLLNEHFDVDVDQSRYVINVKSGYSASKLFRYLKENKLQGEMCDGNNIVFILSSFNDEQDFKYIYQVLLNAPYDNFKTDLNQEVVILDELPVKAIEPYEAINNKNTVLLNLNDSVGNVCGENIVPYPPGVPMLIAGEIIENRHIEMIEFYLKNKVSIIGIQNDKIKVIQM